MIKKMMKVTSVKTTNIQVQIILVFKSHCHLRQHTDIDFEKDN